MKILYGVQGTGNGHTTRARIMAKHFNRLGVDVDYFFSGRESSKYFDMDVFGNYTSAPGMTFSHQNGKVQIIETAKQLRLGRFIKDVKELDLSGYDLVLNDFEPISAWAAKRQNKKVVAISHQASFLSHSVPIEQANIFTRGLIRWFAPADIHLGVHWLPFSNSIIPPFIDSHELCNGSVIENKILVYLPFEQLDTVVDYLQQFPQIEFYCYHPDAEVNSAQNVHLRKPCRDGFLTDLMMCQGVVANAGFELSSEALRYGKKILVKPLQGQFEQASNALTLNKMGMGQSMEYLNVDAMSDWLDDVAKPAMQFPSDPTPLIEWLLAPAGTMEQMTKRLWQGINLPQIT